MFSVDSFKHLDGKGMGRFLKEEMRSPLSCAIATRSNPCCRLPILVPPAEHLCLSHPHPQSTLMLVCVLQNKLLTVAFLATAPKWPLDVCCAYSTQPYGLLQHQNNAMYCQSGLTSWAFTFFYTVTVRTV